MPRPLSNDLRKRIIKAIFEDGLSCSASARYYKVSISSAIRLKNHYINYKSYKPLKAGGRKQHKLSKFDSLVRDFIFNTPDATLFEICDFLEKNKLKVSHMSVFRYLEHIGFSLKKRQFMRENNCESMCFTEERSGKNIKE